MMGQRSQTVIMAKRKTVHLAHFLALLEFVKWDGKLNTLLHPSIDIRSGVCRRMFGLGRVFDLSGITYLIYESFIVAFLL